MADTFLAMVYMISTSYIDKKNLETTHGLVLCGLIIIGQKAQLLADTFNLTLASLDRYYALCRPFEYGSSRLHNNIGKLLLTGTASQEHSWLKIG